MNTPEQSAPETETPEIGVPLKHLENSAEVKAFLADIGKKYPGLAVTLQPLEEKAPPTLEAKGE